MGADPAATIAGNTTRIRASATKIKADVLAASMTKRRIRGGCTSTRPGPEPPAAPRHVHHPHDQDGAEALPRSGGRRASEDPDGPDDDQFEDSPADERDERCDVEDRSAGVERVCPEDALEGGDEQLAE